MIFTDRPEDFDPIFDVVGCFCICEQKILLLLRQDNKPMGNTWCIPGGKIETSERAWLATIREVFQETRLVLEYQDLEQVSVVYVRYDEYDFVYHLFKACVQPKAIRLKNDEHKSYRWVSPKEALSMNLIEDEDSCIRMAFSL